MIEMIGPGGEQGCSAIGCTKKFLDLYDALNTESPDKCERHGGLVDGV